MPRGASRLVAISLCAALAACASRTLEELTADGYGLVIVTLAGTYPFWNEHHMDGAFYWATIESIEQPAIRLRISSGRHVAGGDDRIRRTHVVNTGGAHPGHLNVVRLRAGRYAMREWVIERITRPFPSPPTPVTQELRGIRGPLGIEFEVRPGEVVYLGEVVLHEDRSVVVADCRGRDAGLLKTRIEGFKAADLRPAALGKAPC